MTRGAVAGIGLLLSRWKNQYRRLSCTLGDPNRCAVCGSAHPHIPFPNHEFTPHTEPLRRDAHRKLVAHNFLFGEGWAGPAPVGILGPDSFER